MINQSVTCCTLGKLIRWGNLAREKENLGGSSRLIGLGNVHAQISLEIAHVSLFAGYGEFRGCN